MLDTQTSATITTTPTGFDHLTPAEEQQFWAFGIGPTQTLEHNVIHAAFEKQAKKNPTAVAARFLDQSITYAELDNQANLLAALLKKHHVHPGDAVPIFLERGISMIVGIMATLKAGAAYAPQHVGVAPDAQLTHVASELDAKVVLTIAKFKDQVYASTGLPCIAIDEFTHSMQSIPTLYLPSTAQNTSEHTPHHPSMREQTANRNKHPLNAAMVLFTSGTTGKPNGVKVTHKNLCNILLTSPGNLNIKPGTKVSQILSISFDMAAWEILGCLVNGGTLLIRGKDIAETAGKANVIIATPSILSRIPPEACTDAQTVAVAGEPCPRSLADQWSAKLRFYNSCGPTETTIVNTMLAHDAKSDVLSIGVPTPNNTVYILDQEGRPCHIGETGEMWAGGMAVTAGYLNNPELTSQRYRDDPFLGGNARMFNTRDLGRWTKNGTLEHLGRTDDQVKIRGFRVELDSVSSILESQANCDRATVLKIDDRTLIAFVSPLGIDPEAAKQSVSTALPYYCVPAEVHVLPKLPLTSRGKIDKRLLLDAAHYRRQHRTHTNNLSTVTEPEDDSVTLRCTRLEQHQVASDNRITEYKLRTLPEKPKSIAAKASHHRFYHYWRLVALIAIINVAFLGYGLFSADWWSFTTGFKVDLMLNMAVANLTVAILFRQQYIVNLLFKMATSTPLSAPLRFRQLMGKVYHFGGIHVGGAVFGTIWMLIAVSMLFFVSLGNIPGPKASGLTLFAATQLVLVLSLLVCMAKPSIRQKFHNQFELVHRFGGWFSLVLFWSVALSFIADTHTEVSYATALAKSMVFWALLITTLSILMPWLRLKRVPVRYERPSDHVVLANFDYGVTPFAGSSTTLSRSPLTEWHSFANVPAPGRSGFRLTISRAGDWTGKLIDDLPDHLWVKGIPTAGVGNVDQLFKRVVWVATGSGIGPTLPHLLSREVPAHLIWSTRNARKTYGDGLVDEIIAVEPNAVIWDTDKHGRPDLVQIAFAAVKDFDAEAVIVIANEKLTRLVVHNMEARGIPAYGAIWDS